MFFSIDVSSGSVRTQSKAWMEMDIGSGYQIISGTDSYGYNRTSGAGFSTNPIHAVVHIQKSLTSAKIRIRAKRITGSSSLVSMANASSFTGIIDL